MEERSQLIPIGELLIQCSLRNLFAGSKMREKKRFLLLQFNVHVYFKRTAQ